LEYFKYLEYLEYLELKTNVYMEALCLDRTLVTPNFFQPQAL